MPLGSEGDLAGGKLIRIRLVLGVLAALVTLAPTQASAQRSPTPEPNFAVDVAPRPCALEGRDRFERRFYEIEGWEGPNYERYPGACQRLRFSFGPITVKPGQNDVLVEPVRIEKPMRDGFITRFKPNLVRADGSVPPVDQVHLHHGTWLSEPSYGSGPFFAAGEEKTIAPFPRGYGMPVKATDTWLLLYMVHSAVSQPMEAYITYDVDFVPQAQAQELGLQPAYPVWLDVRPSGYPVFNVQRGFGSGGECTWPREECAAHDPFGRPFTGQGEPGNGTGTDFKLPDAGGRMGRIANFQGGTLIGIGGHLHPGGLTNDIDLVRPGGEVVRVRKRGRIIRRRNGTCVRNRRGFCKRRWRTVERRLDSVRIYTGEAQYWNRQDRSRGGGPPTSWDFSMKVTGLPHWSVEVKPGDILRSNATYDAEVQSTYENMGIAVTLLVPHTEDGRPQAPAANPFRLKRDRSTECRSGGLTANPPRLCDKGIPTHGHYRENGNYGGPAGEWSNPRRGLPTNNVGVVDFLYEPGDLSTLSMTGLPTVRLGSRLRFTNLEGGWIYHTATSCAFPCLGPTGAAFPLADGRTSSGGQIDFDSSEMGVGVPAIGPTKQRLDYELDVSQERGFKPGDVVTYFCRIHPSMRGGFEVTGE